MNLLMLAADAAETMPDGDAVLQYVKLLVTWPVVTLFIILFLKTPLTALINACTGEIPKLTKANWGSATFEFANPKVTDTAIGEVNATAVPASDIRTRFNTDSQVFRSGAFGFEIAYPLGSRWKRVFPNCAVFWTEEEKKQSEEILTRLQKTIGVSPEFFVMFLSNIGGFNPNVNVTVEPWGSKTLSDYVALNYEQIAKLGWKRLACEVDSTTNGASFASVSSWRVEGGKELRCHHLQRVIIAKDLGLAFVATASTLEGVEMPKGLDDEINQILNSFAVFRTAEGSAKVAKR